MALSITRPDPSSPADVSTATFSSSRRGFDSDEVREFLRMVAAELARLQDRETQLAKDLQAARQAPTVSVTELDEAAAAGLLGEEASRIVATARETASQIKVRAEEASARLLIEANEEAQRVRADAEIEAGRRRQDAAALAEDEMQMAKQQGRDMVNEARAYRERVLGELARRREAARQQIEQLIASRDRLMQSFEKSRLIAVEVIAEMAPQAATSDLIDLSPITGPVPIVARSAALPKPEPEPDQVAEAITEEVPIVEEATVVGDVTVVEESTVVAPVERPAAVDDLFARLRAESVKAKDSPQAKPKSKSKSKAKPSPTSKPEPKDVVDAEASPLSVFQPSPAEPQIEVDTIDSPFGRRDAELNPLITSVARNLKRVLADEQNDVLLVLGRRDAVKTLAALLPEADKHIRRYADAINDDLTRAAQAGAAGVGDGAADDKRATKLGQSALPPAIDALASTIITPLRERLGRAISSADGDNGELVGLTRTVYREWKTRRIDEHVDHILHMAFGRGAFAVLQAGTPVCWAVDPSGPSCPDAEDNALAGVVHAGDAFPTEHVSAPAHEGCRCMLVRAAR